MTIFTRIFGRKDQQEERVHVIDLEKLLQELGEDAPSGPEDLEYDPDFIDLAQQIEGTPEKRVGETIIEERRDPPWREMKAKALALMARTHDIRVAIFLLRALLHTDQLNGFRDGIQLLTGLVEKYWETLYPQLDPDDDNDPTQRVNILMDLCARDTVLLPLMKTPLCSSRALGTFSLRDIHIAAGKLTVTEGEQKNVANGATIGAAFKDCPQETLQENHRAITESLACLGGIETYLNEKIGTAAAPHFQEVRDILQEMSDAVAKHLVETGMVVQPVPEAAPQPDDPPPAAPRQSMPSTTPQRGTPMDEIASRQDVIRALEKICVYYEQHEPASPVPLLLKRAIGLVDKDFLEILADLAPESVAQIKHIGGISEG